MRRMKVDKATAFKKKIWNEVFDAYNLTLLKFSIVIKYT